MKIRLAMTLVGLSLALLLPAFQMSSTLCSEVHDVAVIDVTVNPAWAIPVGMSVTINATIENQGTSIETFKVTAYFDNHTIQALGVTDLAPGSNTSLTFFWWVFPYRWHLFSTIYPLWTPGNRTVTIKVEADVVPGEVDTDDNVYIDGTVTIIWMIPDVDGDGKISIKDVANLAIRFGLLQGDPEYDKAYDFNQDSKIDIKDIAIGARCFGRIYWFG